MGAIRPTAVSRPRDALAVSTVAWVRVVVASGVAAAGSFPDDLHTSAEVLFAVIGLLWVPWSIVVLFASERPNAPVALYGGPIGDLLVLVASMSLVPSTGEAAISGSLLVVAFAAYSVGRVFAAVLAIATLSGTMLVQASLDSTDRVAPAVVVMFAATAVAIVLLIDRTTALHARAAARVALLQSSSDAVLDRIADGVVVTDARGHVLACNPAAERIFGPLGNRRGMPCQEVLGLRIDERRLTCEDGCALLARIDDDARVGGQEAWREDGDRRQPLLADVAAVTDEEGVVVEVNHSMRDVSKLKQSEEAKTLFLATASHELKTPLTVIRGYVETLRTGRLDAAQEQAAFDAVHRRAIELSEIIDRLLLSSRIEAGRVDLDPGDVQLAAVVRERAAAMGAARGREIGVHLDPAAESVLADGAALATVIDHLLDNAVKYSPAGGPISVRTLGGDPVLVTVTDAGIGMDVDEAQRCFDKFWQAEGGDVRRFGGTGIGLYIVRSLVDAMGGRITAESRRGVGTTFVIELQRSGADRVDSTPDRRGEATMIREFMRQLGVPERTP